MTCDATFWPGEHNAGRGYEPTAGLLPNRLEALVVALEAPCQRPFDTAPADAKNFDCCGDEHIAVFFLKQLASLPLGATDFVDINDTVIAHAQALLAVFVPVVQYSPDRRHAC